MNIIDMHTHTFPPKIAQMALDKLSRLSGTVAFTSGTEEALITSSQAANITYSVILPVATSPEQVRKINDGVIALAIDRKERGIISFGAMHPAFDNPDRECARLAEHGIRGIKLHPAYAGVDFDAPLFLPILKAAADNHLAVTTHAGIDIGIPEKDYCSTEMILQVLDRVPDLKLILAHMGGWHCWEKVAKDLSDAPIYVDTSFSLGKVTPRQELDPSKAPYLLSDTEFVDLCNALGTAKVMFGTDCPWTDQKTEVEKILALPLTESERQDIFYNNAKKLLLV